LNYDYDERVRRQRDDDEYEYDRNPPVSSASNGRRDMR
jgi:hypothetical protein